MLNRPRIVKIDGVAKETPTVKTFTFRDEHCARAEPGNFVMVWIPGVDEVPLSLSVIGPGDRAGVTVMKVGEGTQALHEKHEGDLIGLRGPYGSSFSLSSGKVLVVGGGVGVAPLAPLVEKLAEVGADVTSVIGAKTKADLLFLNRVQKSSRRLIATTDDGSYGIRGLASDPVKELLNSERFDMIYSCGKELMLSKIFQEAEKRNTPVQVSLERLIRCGVGLCGSCCIGAYRVCRDGPVFSSEELRVIPEFGRFTRNSSGRLTPLQGSV